MTAQPPRASHPWWGSVILPRPQKEACTRAVQLCVCVCVCVCVRGGGEEVAQTVDQGN